MALEAEPKKSGQRQRILVMILAHNEAATIGGVIRRVKEAVADASVLVVDDGSTDGTGRAARDAGGEVATPPFNLGIGGAAQTGQLYALRGGFDVMVRIDGDGQHPPEDIPRLLDALNREGANMVIASRFADGCGTYRPPLLRRMGISFFASAVSLFCRRRLTDTTSGFYAADRAAVAHMASMNAFDYPEVESIVSLHKAGLRITEVPCQMAHRSNGRSSISLLRGMYYMVKVSLSMVVAVASPRRRAR